MTYESFEHVGIKLSRRPKVTGAVKPKKEKVVPGSLYMLIEVNLLEFFPH